MWVTLESLRPEQFVVDAATRRYVSGATVPSAHSPTPATSSNVASSSSDIDLKVQQES